MNLAKASAFGFPKSKAFDFAAVKSKAVDIAAQISHPVIESEARKVCMLVSRTGSTTRCLSTGHPVVRACSTIHCQYRISRSDCANTSICCVGNVHSDAYYRPVSHTRNHNLSTIVPVIHFLVLQIGID
eukprot:155406-Rhodomonas_salina.4